MLPGYFLEDGYVLAYKVYSGGEGYPVEAFYNTYGVATYRNDDDPFLRALMKCSCYTNGKCNRHYRSGLFKYWIERVLERARHDPRGNRRMFISNNSSDCATATGWLMLKESYDKCDWGNPRDNKFPFIIFSPTSTMVQFKSGVVAWLVVAGHKAEGQQPVALLNRQQDPSNAGDIPEEASKQDLSLLHTTSKNQVCLVSSTAYVQQGDWLLAFRLVAGNNQPGYDAYMDVNRNDDDLLVRALTPCSCLSINGTCNRQYRGSVLSLWTQLPILKCRHPQVKLSLYEGGKEKAFAVFNGVGTTFTSWFTNDRLENSSWTDLKASAKNFFSIIGDDGLKRRLFINNAYPGCANDVGWLVVKDVEDTCTWGKSTSFPLILYSATGSKVVYQSTGLMICTTLPSPRCAFLRERARADTSLARRFFINSVYPGCANDAGWLVVKDNADTCSWGQVTAGASYPLILYSATGNRVLYPSPGVVAWLVVAGHKAKGQQPVALLNNKVQPKNYERKPQWHGVCVVFSTAYVQQGDWLLAFRLVAGNNQPGYDAYMDVNRNDDDLLVRALTPCSCLSINGTCNRQYRGSVLSLWTQLPILKVKLSLYEGGKEKAFAVFNGVGTTFTSWFTNDRLENSSWTDLKASSKNFFSIIGDDGLKRRLFINNAYPGCANDVGWLVVKDVEDTCTWGKSTSFPLILYSATGSKVVYQSTAVSKADSLAVWVSFKEPETFGESCF
ncbi:hypothetical protein C0Q70_02938 [Pomacea canaliculata]|uniref:Uncharacterized protein n=1 Tax=Pomacea canaliculata TaxID=400727 RepID=A0A2T7PRB9_POMCA|nr:hypothetical protein C0Q70_02938 [Pomacea canaliculata]